LETLSYASPPRRQRRARFNGTLFVIAITLLIFPAWVRDGTITATVTLVCRPPLGLAISLRLFRTSRWKAVALLLLVIYGFLAAVLAVEIVSQFATTGHL
jgi:hypothetical protein